MLQLPRLYPILDTTLLEARRFEPLTAARILLDYGVHWIQWRHKGPLTRARLREADQLSELCRKHSATFIVNDRADVALLTESAGVHLGQEDLPPFAVREVMGGSHGLIGYSTHTENQLIRAADQPVDYVALGPIYSTSSKQHPDPVVGLESLGLWRKHTQRPLVAIGGITRESAIDVLEVGADSVAVIGDLFPAPCDEEMFRRRLDEWARLVLW